MAAFVDINLETWQRGGRFRALVAALFLLCHAPFLTQPPNGFHQWREIDTATVTENMAFEAFDLLAPRVNVRGAGTGIVGMEFPAFNAFAAMGDRVFGFSHVWPRMVSLLSGLCAVLAIGAIARRLLPNDLFAANAAAMLAASSPLLFFYSGKIMPDTLALALSLWGFERFLAWDHVRFCGGSTGWARAIASALGLLASAAIKPTFLCLGLAMAVRIVDTPRQDERWRPQWTALLRPRFLFFAALVLAPAALWFHHARALTEIYGNHYFYLGDTGFQELASLAKPQFYQNVLLTWPWEMALALPTSVLVVVQIIRRVWSGRGRERWWRPSTAWTLGLWAVGALSVCILTAEHCATPHDYYFLPWVPVLTIVASRAASLAITGTSWRRPLMVIGCIVLPLAGILRVAPMRYDLGTERDFAATRAAVAAAVPRGALAVALDPLPGAMLYFSGLKGWRFGADLTPTALTSLYNEGARFVVLPKGGALGGTAERIRMILPAPVASGGMLSVHRLPEPPILPERGAGLP